MRHGKKPTRKQKIRLGRVGLSPENWLIVREKPSGELVILHKHTDRIRVIPSGVGRKRVHISRNALRGVIGGSPPPV